MEQAGPVRPSQGESTEVLKAKYLDYCSAQLADLLLYLTADEIYVLAQRAARESEGSSQVPFDRIVEVATRWLQRKIVLPPFEIWVEDYRQHPDRYEEYFMGLWQSEGRPVDVDG